MQKQGELYRHATLYGALMHQASKRGNKTALFEGDSKITYRTLKKHADNLAAFFAERGIKKGDKVALFMRNCFEFVYSAFAASKLGAVIVPINTFLKAEELSYILKDSGAVFLVASTTLVDTVGRSEAAVLCKAGILWEGEGAVSKENNYRFDALNVSNLQVDEAPFGLEENAVIFYTSGTTGKPKGAMLSNRNILSNIDSGRIAVALTPKDRSIVFLPMFHSFTFSIALMLPLATGASVVVIKSLKPFSNIFKQVLTKRVSVFLGVPDVYNALAKAKLPWYFMWFNNLRIFISGAAPLQPKTLEAMARKFKRAVLLEGYGLSEASPAVSINMLTKQKAGSVGPALPGYEIKVVDEAMNECERGSIGDIIVRGDNVMMGYLNRPEATAETIVNGWLLTGDMGYMDEEGFLYIVDRKKDLIISKGINIYPREIEDVIDRFEGVAASAVIGVYDEKSGEIPIAYIELEEGVDKVDEAALKRYLKEHLANYKIPKKIHTIEALPKNATGKVLKRELKRQLEGERQG